MQSVSPRGRLRFADGEALWEIVWGRIRESMAGGRFWSAVIVLLLTYNVARSTATFHWVDGIDAVTPVALLGAMVMGALAVSPVFEPVALAAGAVLSVPIALASSWSQIHLHHPTTAMGPQILSVWWSGTKDGSLTNDPSFFLFLICVLMWVTGGWLAWCVLRWRKPMLGLIPGAAAFATNLLNIVPGVSDQNGYTLAMLVLTIAMLLWNNYTGSIANATQARVKLSGDARWDFWESGLVAMTAVIVLSIFLPPLSTIDRTVDVESGMFASWAQLQQELSHPGFIDLGRGGVGTTGFSEDVKLSGALQRTRDIVFTYTITGDYGGPRYFRGVDDTQTVGGVWRYSPVTGSRYPIFKNQQIAYGENYDGLGLAKFNVRMVHAPVGYSSVLFYPGILFQIDRTGTAEQVPLVSARGDLLSIDRLDSAQPATSSGGYTIFSEYSAATVQQLESAGTIYPDWVKQFGVLPPLGYRPNQVIARIHNLAFDITAGTTNPYDAATAIESYLRSTKFTYDLTITPPAGVDPMEWFLFQSHTGYCEYFATAMGDMLRALGIPARLVSGYGPGQFDSTVNSYVVRGEDAHTWVEAYFPGFGWIPFEPTADSANIYQPIIRGQSGANACLRDNGCDTSSIVPGVVGGTVPTPRDRTRNDLPIGPATGGFTVKTVLDSSIVTKAAAVAMALLLLLLVAAVRYLRPRTVMAVWKRTVTLTELAGAKRGTGETPLEMGRRLRRSFPEAAEPVDALTSGFAVAAYAPPDEAATTRSSVMEAWTALRPVLLRRVFERFRPGGR